MTEETPFEKYIQQLGFTPGSPEWRSMTLAEQVLASFAAIMCDQVGDWLVNVVGAPPEALTLYCEALEAIGASWVATDIRVLAASDLDSDDSQAKLMKLNEQVEASRVRRNGLDTEPTDWSYRSIGKMRFFRRSERSCR